LANEIANDEKVAESAGIHGTPSFLIGASGGPMIGFSPTGPAAFDKAIERLVPR
jgi:protein-disulfide isomerase